MPQVSQIQLLKWEKSLADGQLANSKGTIYTSVGKTVVTDLRVFNTAVTTETVALYIKRSGSSSRQFFRAVLAQNEFAAFEASENVTLSSGDLIEGDTTNASAVNYLITGMSE